MSSIKSVLFELSKQQLHNNHWQVHLGDSLELASAHGVLRLRTHKDVDKQALKVRHLPIGVVPRFTLAVPSCASATAAASGSIEWVAAV